MVYRDPIVDVAIQLYGKPNQTALALHSLLRHSGRWIGRVFLTVEKQQPREIKDLDTLIGRLDWPIVVHRPAVHIGWRRPGPRWKSWFARYRHSFRYQFAWESAASRFLFVLHNDMLFRGDLIGAYLRRIGNALAIGKVGQCWNCSAALANRCGPGRFQDYKPERAELVDLFRKYPGPRQESYAPVLHNREHQWPLPECRLNEFAALIDLNAARQVPNAPIFGAFGGVDTGSEWFWHVVRKGYRIEHLDFEPWATHAWATAPLGGKSANTDPVLYASGESRALAILQRDYGWPLEKTGEVGGEQPVYAGQAEGR